MNIPLKKHQADWIAEQMRIGRYASEIEAIEDARAAKIAQDQAAWAADGEALRERMQESLAQIERGEVVAADDAFFERLRERVRKVARGNR
jgi:Arc/MetJ-type ribon-helix-helix transcriptional regulator